ncbi:hypothetical protein ZTR_10641 [Talaromyces verruculosus]|nr:hypothetical protein ZTR_10641 [Talaromyces verruculosus]
MASIVEDDGSNVSSALPDRPPLFVAQIPVSQFGSPLIQCVLIANRGEIACRIIAACRKLDVKSISIYVKEDEGSRHVKSADEAINLGSIDQDGGNPFLNIDLIVETAVKTGADAIHPGYGYLSENAKFADAVREAGLIFIGPTSKAMSTLGDKRTAKDYLRQHDQRVPLIPGFAGDNQNIAELENAAEKIGYPVMLKASAGGGGRGMRIVHEPAKLKAEFASAQSEAARSFGSGDCILEKYIKAGKHIEFQIIGDKHGNVLSLWDRECSIQRRHQKVIEESPSPWLTPQKRREMSEVAVRLGKLLGYENAGTVEFVFDVSDGSFYFLEMNTRLQVEHPITEEVTGIDIVSLQFFVAAGGNLMSIPWLRSIHQTGHAIECRLCAEDPQSNFFPEHGTVRFWQPATTVLTDLKNVRFETAIETGSQVSIHFDSMIAKIVIWAPTRAMAIQKAATVLAHTVCIGLKTNQRFMQNCLLHPSFHEPGYTTSFIPEHLDALITDPYAEISDTLWRSLALVPSVFARTARKHLSSLTVQRPFHEISSSFRNQRGDPVSAQSAIVIAGTGSNQIQLLCQWISDAARENPKLKACVQQLPEVPTASSSTSKSFQATKQYNAISNALRATDTSNQDASYEFEIHDCKAALATSKGSTPWIYASMRVLVNGKVYNCYLTSENCDLLSTSSTTGQAKQVFCHFPTIGTWFLCRYYDLLSYCESIRPVAEVSQAQGKTVKAPMPCKVLGVLKKDGDEVKTGEVVIVVESMKMEMNVSAPANGTFRSSVKKADAVNEGTVLCWIE